jgi:hypothetical protein
MGQRSARASPTAGSLVARLFSQVLSQGDSAELAVSTLREAIANRPRAEGRV